MIESWTQEDKTIKSFLKNHAIGQAASLLSKWGNIRRTPVSISNMIGE